MDSTPCLHPSYSQDPSRQASAGARAPRGAEPVPSLQGGWRAAGSGSYRALQHVLSFTQIVLDAFKGWQCGADSEHRLMGHPLEQGEL